MQPASRICNRVMGAGCGRGALPRTLSPGGPQVPSPGECGVRAPGLSSPIQGPRRTGPPAEGSALTPAEQPRAGRGAPRAWSESGVWGCAGKCGRASPAGAGPVSNRPRGRPSPHTRGAWETPESRRWRTLPRATYAPAAAPHPHPPKPTGRCTPGSRALPAPPRGTEPALTGAQETLGQPSEAARTVSSSIVHVGAEQQRGRGGEGEAGASGPPRGPAAAACAGAEAGAAPADAREAGGARAAGGRAEREPGWQRPRPGAGWEQETLESGGQQEPPPPAAAAGTSAGGAAHGSCRLPSASIAAAAASRRRRRARPSWEPHGEGKGR